MKMVVRLILRWLSRRRLKAERIIHCRDCGRRAHCQICEQCLGDNGYCSLGVDGE